MKLKIAGFTLCLLICHQIAAWEFVSKKNQIFFYAPLQQHELYHLRNVFIESFTRNYKDNLQDDTLINYLCGYLPQAIDDEIASLKNDTSVHHIGIKNNKGDVVGFIAFNETDIQGQVYVRQMCIQPDYWNQGLGRDLLFSILKVLPHYRHFVLVTERINKNAQAFYHHLGFVECNYTHQGYETQYYLGLELYI